MLVFSVIDGIVRTLLGAITVLQVASVLLTGTANQNVLQFGRGLSVYTYHILLFITFNTEVMPFPFSDWNQTAELQRPDDNNN
jgi:hypothetical protein